MEVKITNVFVLYLHNLIITINIEIININKGKCLIISPRNLTLIHLLRRLKKLAHPPLLSNFISLY